MIEYALRGSQSIGIPREYPMTTEEQTRVSLANVGRDFMYGKISEQEWLEIRVRLHARLDELVGAMKL